MRWQAYPPLITLTLAILLACKKAGKVDPDTLTANAPSMVVIP